MFKNPTVNLSALCSSCVKSACCSSWVYLHISSCRQQHPKCKQAICLVSPPFICVLHSSSNCTNKNLNTSERKERQTVHATFKQLCLDNHWESDMFIWTYFHNDWFCHLSKYWVFLLNHPVDSSYKYLVLSRLLALWWLLFFKNVKFCGGIGKRKESLTV